MPQIDFDALITARLGEGNNLKISCKTLQADYGADSSEDEDIPGGQYDIVHPDDPPESFWLSKDAEYDWLDRNAFYERKDSTRGNSSSTNFIKPTNSNHNSQRFSANLKSKASIIGLPRTQKATFVNSSCRRTCASTNVRLFPKRPAPAGKSTIAVTEPGSPKVSCTGRVRSKRGRRRSNSLKRSDKPVEKSKACREKPAEESKAGGSKEKKKKKTGFYSKVMSIFTSKKTHKKPSRSYSRKVAEVVQVEKPAAVETLRKSVSIKAASEPPALGEMKRFASGRQSGSWPAEDRNQVYPEPLDFDRCVCLTASS